MGESVRLFGPLIAFSLFVIAGSLVARLALGEQQTFLSMGLFLLLGGPVTYWLIVTSSNPEAMVRYISGAFLAFSAVAIAMKSMQVGAVSYHAYEHIVIVCAAYPMLASKRFASLVLGVFLVALASVAENKLTGYIVALMIFAFVYLEIVTDYRRRLRDATRSGLVRLLTIFGIVFGALAAYGAYQAAKTFLPGGNPVYREHTYERAWNRFLDSPLWGTAYSQSAVDRFELFEVATSTQNLPTHSDPLDIMAHGGLIGTMLFAWGLMRLLRRGHSAVWAERMWEGASQMHSLCKLHFLVMLSGVAVFSFNPVLNHPPSALLYWTSAAALLAVIRCRGPSAALLPVRATSMRRASQ
jgi:hypothetical protein